MREQGRDTTSGTVVMVVVGMETVVAAAAIAAAVALEMPFLSSLSSSLPGWSEGGGKERGRESKQHPILPLPIGDC